MALSAKILTFGTGTGTSNIAVTGAGFTPKVVLFFGSRHTAAGSAVHWMQSFGAATSSSARVCGHMFIQDARPTARGQAQMRNDCCGALLTVGDVTPEGLLDFVSLDADGFTVVPDDAFASDWQFSALCLGGDDLTNAVVAGALMPGSTGNFSVTGLGFQPDCLILIGARMVSSFTTSLGSGAALCLGWATSSSARGAVAMSSEDGTASTNSRSIIRTDRCGVWLNVGADSAHTEVDFVSFDSDGFTLNRVVGTAGLAYGYIALKTGGHAVVGTTATQTSTGQWAVTATGITPTVALFAGTMQATATESSPSVNAQLAVGLGTSSSNRAGYWAIDEDNLADSDVQARYETTKLLLNNAGTAGFAAEGEADLVSFASETITLDQTDADVQANLLTFLAIGGASGGGEEPTFHAGWASRSTVTLGAGMVA